MKPPSMIVPEHTASAGADIVPHEYPSTPDKPSAFDEDPQTPEAAAAAGALKEWQFWNEQVAAALTHERLWRAEAEASERVYFGPQKTVQTNGEDPNALPKIDEKTALIHANIDVLKPLVYSETPQPIVRRRYNGDFKTDATDLMATEATNRLALYLLDTEDFDEAMIGARDDWLIAARGGVSVVYKEYPRGDRTIQRVMPRHREWQRILLCADHAWEDMPWLAIEHSLTRAKIEKRWPDKVARFSFNKPGLRGSTQAAEDDDKLVASSGIIRPMNETAATTISPFDTATVMEIWDKERMKVVWWSSAYTDGVLEEADDPLQLECFYPVPRLLTATTKGRRMTPRPDIRYYEQRAEEVRIATEKMSSLLQVISVSGLIPASKADEFKKLFSGDNQLIPVESWLALLQKGGMQEMVQWLPLQPIVAALQALQMLRQQARDAMFEASGVSDVMRAQGDPNETATAQQLKGRYAGMRLSERQRRMAYFALDTLRMMIDLATGLFETEYLADICGLDLPMTEEERLAEIARRQAEMESFQMQTAMHQEATQMAEAKAAAVDQASQEQGMQLEDPDPLDPGPAPVPPQYDREVPETSWELVHARIKDDLHRKITVSIETSSTILADEASDKEQRVEFISAFAQFVGALLPMVQAGQMPMKTMKEMLLFGVRGFPKSRSLEEQINQLPDELPTPEAVEDASITVANIKAETEKLLQKDDQEFQLKMKGVDILQAAAEHHASPGPDSPEVPQEPDADDKPKPRPKRKG